MGWTAFFFLNSVLFGAGLAMDAFSVSLANGLRSPGMSRGKAVQIAGTFGIFQMLMPLIGWFCVRTIASAFRVFHRLVPWIALVLLLYIGGKMIAEGIRHDPSDNLPPPVGLRGLLVQGVATSIDALSVGFTIADYRLPFALAESLIIGIVTFWICIGGLRIGRRFGTLLAGKASIVGGLILIAIGFEIVLKHLLGS